MERPARTRARMSVDEIARRGCSSTARRSSGTRKRARKRRDRLGRRRRRAARRRAARAARIRLGLAPRREPGERLGERMNHGSTGRAAGRQRGQRVDGVAGARPVDLRAVEGEGRIAGDRPLDHRDPAPGPGVTARPAFCHGSPAGMNRTRDRPRTSRASSATARWARCGRVEGAAEDPDRPSPTPGRAAHRAVRFPGVGPPLELDPPDPHGVAAPGRRPAAALRRCPAGRGRAGTARRIPRRRSWSGRRSARCGDPARGRRRPRARA